MMNNIRKNCVVNFFFKLLIKSVRFLNDGDGPFKNTYETKEIKCAVMTYEKYAILKDAQ